MGSNPSLATRDSLSLIYLISVTFERSELMDESILSIMAKIVMLAIVHNILIIGPRG
ncbi:MAG: hypothetical protein ACTJLM_05130 [Ehrlichia sp.]